MIFQRPFYTPNWNEFFGYFIEASSEIWRKMKYLLKENKWVCPNVQGATSLEGKTPKPKLAGDSANLRLCDSCDYFASPLLIVQTD